MHGISRGSTTYPLAGPWGSPWPVAPPFAPAGANGPRSVLAPRRRHAWRTTTSMPPTLRTTTTPSPSGEGSICRLGRRKQLDRRMRDVGQCRRGAARRGATRVRSREVVWAVGAGIRVACEPRATLRSHVHRLEAPYGRCCLRVPHVAQHVVFVASELQISSNRTVCGSAGRIAL